MAARATRASSRAIAGPEARTTTVKAPSMLSWKWARKRASARADGVPGTDREVVSRPVSWW